MARAQEVQKGEPGEWSWGGPCCGTGGRGRRTGGRGPDASRNAVGASLSGSRDPGRGGRGVGAPRRRGIHGGLEGASVWQWDGPRQPGDCLVQDALHPCSAACSFSLPSPSLLPLLHSAPSPSCLLRMNSARGPLRGSSPSRPTSRPPLVPNASKTKFASSLAQALPRG